ncbi:MAG TPA: exodeoxyribonuclease VII small subunit [Polyangia bacterium]
MGDEAPQAAPVAEGFDVVLERLHEVVERLEAGNLTLEESLQVFEDGIRLSRRGAQILDSAEKRVDILLAGEEGVRTEPFGDTSRGEAAGARPDAATVRTVARADE